MTSKLRNSNIKFSYVYRKIFYYKNRLNDTDRLDDEPFRYQRGFNISIKPLNNENNPALENIAEETDISNISVGDDIRGKSIERFLLPFSGKFSFNDILRGLELKDDIEILFSPCRFYNGTEANLPISNISWGENPPPLPEQKPFQKTSLFTESEVSTLDGVFDTINGTLWKFSSGSFRIKTSVINVTPDNSKFYIILKDNMDVPELNDISNASQYKLIFDTEKDTINFLNKDINVYNFSGNPTITKTGKYNITITLKRDADMSDIKHNGIDYSGAEITVSLETITNTGYYDSSSNLVNIPNRQNASGQKTTGYDNNSKLIKIYNEDGDEIYWKERITKLGDLKNEEGVINNNIYTTLHSQNKNVIVNGEDYIDNKKTWVTIPTDFGDLVRTKTRYKDINFAIPYWNAGYNIWFGADVEGSAWNNSDGVVFLETELKLYP